MNIDLIPAINAEDQSVNVVIETPKGGRHKYKHSPEWKSMTLDKVMPLGHVFPYDFGFIPQTRAQDGDPLDVLVLMDDSAFPGCVAKCRLIGAIEARQTVGRKTFRNDRLLAIPLRSFDYSEVRHLRDLNRDLVHQIKLFFISYNLAQGRRFKVLRDAGPTAARKLLADAIKNGSP